MIGVLALFLLSGLAFTRVPIEARAAVLVLDTPARQIAVLRSGMGAIPASQLRRVELLNLCLEVQGGLILALYPAAARREVARECVRISDAMLVRSEAFGLARLVGVVSRASLGQVFDFTEEMVFARQVAPREGWQATWRVWAVMRYSAPTDFADDGGFAADVLLLAGAHKLRDDLAGLYLRFPDWQARVSEIVAQGGLTATFDGVVRKRIEAGKAG